MERFRVRRQKDEDLERALLEEWWKSFTGVGDENTHLKMISFVPSAALGLSTCPSEPIKWRSVGRKQGQ